MVETIGKFARRFNLLKIAEGVVRCCVSCALIRMPGTSHRPGRLAGEPIIEFQLLFVLHYWFVIVCLKSTGPTRPPALLCIPKVQRIRTE